MIQIKNTVRLGRLLESWGTLFTFQGLVTVEASEAVLETYSKLTGRENLDALSLEDFILLTHIYILVLSKPPFQGQFIDSLVTSYNDFIANENPDFKLRDMLVSNRSIYDQELKVLILKSILLLDSSALSDKSVYEIDGYIYCPPEWFPDQHVDLLIYNRIGLKAVGLTRAENIESLNIEDLVDVLLKIRKEAVSSALVEQLLPLENALQPRIQSILIDRINRKLIINGVGVHLTKMTLALIVIIEEAHPESVSRDMIFDELWGNEHGLYDKLKNLISQLKKKIHQSTSYEIEEIFEIEIGCNSIKLKLPVSEKS